MGKGKNLGDVAKFATYNGYGGALDFNSSGMPTAKKSKSPGPAADMSRFDFRDQVKERVQPARDASLGLISQLQNQANGTAPSLADAQLRAASNRNLSQMMATAAANRGGNAALQNRQLMMQQGDAGRSLAEASATQRLQEQQQAQQALGTLTQAQQQNDLQQIMGPGEQLGKFEEMRFAADVARRNGVKEQQSQVLGAGMQAGSQIASMFAMSDENQKKDIKPAAKKVSGFLDALSAKGYKYKDASVPGTAPGKRTGIMAQDLEKSEMGAELVHEGPAGKMIDTQQGFGAVLAAQAEMNKRLKALEGKKK